jgi:CheY-like chemotaxis protein
MYRTLEGKRIFIVEDDIMNLGVFNTCLSRSGAITLQDVFGYGIIEHILESLPIDLILLDIMLRQGISGYDVYDKIRKHPALMCIPVIAVTSLDPEIEIPKAQAKGFNGFISKPINIREFPQNLAKVLTGRAVWVDAR